MMAFVRYILLLLLLINSLFNATSTSVEEVNDNDLHPFVKVGSKYYLVHTLELDWFGAAHLCRSYDSDLLTIESTAEKDALFTHFTGLFSFMRAWTSSNDLSEEGKYMSLNSGRPMLYNFWGLGEPNNAGVMEDCVEAVINNDKFVMNDNDCFEKLCVICEKRSMLNTCNSALKPVLNNEKITLQNLLDAYLQTANFNNCRE